MSGGGEPRTSRGAVEPAGFTAVEHVNAAEGAPADTWRTIAAAGVDAGGGSADVGRFNAARRVEICRKG